MGADFCAFWVLSSLVREILCWFGVVILWAKSARRFDKQPFCASFGWCGGQGTTLHSIMWLLPSKN